VIPSSKFCQLTPPIRNPRPEAVLFEEQLKAILPTISEGEAALILRRVLEKLPKPKR